MNWNHRVFNIKDQNAGEDLFVVRETYYDENNEVMGSCDLSVMGETLDELKWIANQILKCVEQPVLLPGDEKHPNDIVQELVDSLNHSSIKTGCDMSDIGNEIGLALGKYISKDKIGFELDSLISGIRHGISLVDGTH